jgi:hypothetical protein
MIVLIRLMVLAYLMARILPEPGFPKRTRRASATA